MVFSNLDDFFFIFHKPLLVALLKGEEYIFQIIEKISGHFLVFEYKYCRAFELLQVGSGNQSGGRTYQSFKMNFALCQRLKAFQFAQRRKLFIVFFELIYIHLYNAKRHIRRYMSLYVRSYKSRSLFFVHPSIDKGSTLISWPYVG